jgi:hypothetical protein
MKTKKINLFKHNPRSLIAASSILGMTTVALSGIPSLTSCGDSDNVDHTHYLPDGTN